MGKWNTSKKVFGEPYNQYGRDSFPQGYFKQIIRIELENWQGNH